MEGEGGNSRGVKEVLEGEEVEGEVRKSNGGGR